MDEPWSHYAKGNKPVTLSKSLSTHTNTFWFLLCEVLGAVKFIEAKSRMVVPRGRERENGKLVFTGHRVSVLHDEKISEDGWWWWLHNGVNVLD